MSFFMKGSAGQQGTRSQVLDLRFWSPQPGPQTGIPSQRGSYCPSPLSRVHSRDSDGTSSPAGAGGGGSLHLAWAAAQQARGSSRGSARPRGSGRCCGDACALWRQPAGGACACPP